MNSISDSDLITLLSHCIECAGADETWYAPSSVLDVLKRVRHGGGARATNEAFFVGAHVFMDKSDYMRLHPLAKTPEEALSMQLATRAKGE